MSKSKLEKKLKESICNELGIHLLGGSEEGGEVSMMLVMAKQRQTLPRKNYL